MERRDIIVIGASAGGFDAIKSLVSNLPSDFQSSVFVVWHISPDVRGILPQVLSRITPLTATHATDGAPIKPGHIYIAPPDHHLLIGNDVMRVTRGPKENRFRPAIDPLFRSAAYNYGRRVIGIILSGALDDGTAGLWLIKERGGIAIVQDPSEAEVTTMPESAIKSVRVDHVVPVSGIAPLLKQLTNDVLPENDGKMNENGKTKLEVEIAMESDPSNSSRIIDYGQLSPYTCPECHGVLTSLKEGGRVRFRCHTGHAFSADTLLSTITHSIEESLWNAIRSVQESVLLLNHIGDHYAENNEPRLASLYFRKAMEAERRGQMVKQAVTTHEHLSIDKIRHELDDEPDAIESRAKNNG